MINKRAKDNYTDYERLLSSAKTIKASRILISKDTSNHVDWRKGAGEVSFPPRGDFGLIKVQQMIDKNSIYGFVMTQQSFMKQSICRFDSDGHTHINKDENIPVNEQIIKTPHFHIWNKDGREIAYKTDSIDLHEKSIFQDINQGFSLFCTEFSLSREDKTIPLISVQLNLFPDLTLSDLHAGLKFD